MTSLLLEYMHYIIRSKRARNLLQSTNNLPALLNGAFSNLSYF